MAHLVKIQPWEIGLDEDDPEAQIPRYEITGATKAQLKEVARFITVSTSQDEDWNGDVQPLTSYVVKQTADIAKLEELLQIPSEKRVSVREAAAKVAREAAATKLKTEDEYREAEQLRFNAFVAGLEAQGYKRASYQKYPHSWDEKFGLGGGLSWQKAAHFEVTQPKPWGTDGYRADFYVTNYDGQDVYLLVSDNTGPASGIWVKE